MDEPIPCQIIYMTDQQKRVALECLEKIQDIVVMAVAELQRFSDNRRTDCQNCKNDLESITIICMTVNNLTNRLKENKIRLREFRKMSRLVKTIFMSMNRCPHINVNR